MSAILSPAQTADKPKLLDQVRDVIRRKHFSIRTEQTYVEWIKRYILFHGKRHPNEMAEAEITAFLTHLARAGKVTASTQNQHVKASLTCRERLQKTAACSTFISFARKQTRVFTSATRITFALA
jgi:enoyl reductase-like protein